MKKVANDLSPGNLFSGLNRLAFLHPPTVRYAYVYTPPKSPLRRILLHLAYYEGSWRELQANSCLSHHPDFVNSHGALMASSILSSRGKTQENTEMSNGLSIAQHAPYVPAIAFTESLTSLPPSMAIQSSRSLHDEGDT